MDPDDIKFPKPSDDWFGTDPDTSKGDPTFYKVDNPGGWSIFSYCPVFESGAQGSQCKFNCIPAGCHPVPPNEDDATICTHGV